MAEKVHIDKLYDWFCEFQRETIKAIKEHNLMSKAQNKAFQDARDKLRAKLTASGLADLIDWTPPE